MYKNGLLLIVKHFIQLFGSLEQLLRVDFFLTVVQGQVNDVCDPVLRVDLLHILKQDLSLLHVFLTLKIEHALNTLFDN